MTCLCTLQARSGDAQTFLPLRQGKTKPVSSSFRLAPPASLRLFSLFSAAWKQKYNSERRGQKIARLSWKTGRRSRTPSCQDLGSLQEHQAPNKQHAQPFVRLCVCISDPLD